VCEALGAHGRLDAYQKAYGRRFDELEQRVDNTEAVYDKQAQFLAELQQRVAEHMTVTAREIIVLQERLARLEKHYGTFDNLHERVAALEAAMTWVKTNWEVYDLEDTEPLPWQELD
jgi:hypothetical protein